MPFVILIIALAGIAALVWAMYLGAIFVGGMGAGGLLVVLYGWGEWQKWKAQAEQKRQWEKEQDHRRTLEIIDAVTRASQSRRPADEILTLTRVNTPKLERRK